MAIKLRKLVVQVDETRIEMGQAIDPPARPAVAIAVIDNPYAGRYEATLDALIEAGAELGALLGNRCVEALGIAPGDAQSYGKAAIVGEAGELEHAAAILHPKLGAPFRKTLGKGAALIPSSKKRGSLGVALDIPLGHKDAAYVRSHFDGMEVRLSDAPRADEILVAVAVTDGGRPLPRTLPAIAIWMRSVARFSAAVWRSLPTLSRPISLSWKSRLWLFALIRLTWRSWARKRPPISLRRCRSGSADRA